MGYTVSPAWYSVCLSVSSEDMVFIYLVAAVNLYVSNSL